MLQLISFSDIITRRAKRRCWNGTESIAWSKVVLVRRKHRRTLEAIFRRPTATGIRWEDIVSLLNACGAYMEERKGSRVAVEIGETTAILHRPHPHSTIDKGMVADLRKFLEAAGVKTK